MELNQIVFLGAARGVFRFVSSLFRTVPEYVPSSFTEPSPTGWDWISQPADVGTGAFAEVQPVAWFVSPPYEHVDTTAGTVTVDVVADHYNGIDRVEFFTNLEQETPVVVSAETVVTSPTTLVQYKTYRATIPVGAVNNSIVEIRAVVYPATAGRPRVLQGIIEDVNINTAEREYPEAMRGHFSLFRILTSSETTYTVGSAGSYATPQLAMSAIGDQSGLWEKHVLVFQDNEQHDLGTSSAAGFVANKHCPIIFRGNTTNTGSADYRSAELGQSDYGPLQTTPGQFRYTNAIISLEDLNLRNGEIQFYNNFNQLMIVKRCLFDSNTVAMVEYDDGSGLQTLSPPQSGIYTGSSGPDQDYFEFQQSTRFGAMVVQTPAQATGYVNAILTSADTWAGRRTYIYDSEQYGGGFGVGIVAQVGVKTTNATLDTSHAPCTVGLTNIGQSWGCQMVFQRDNNAVFYDTNDSYVAGDRILVFYKHAWRVYEALVNSPSTADFDAWPSSNGGSPLPEDNDFPITPTGWERKDKHIDTWQGETYQQYTIAENYCLTNITMDSTSISQPFIWRITGKMKDVLWRDWLVDSNNSTKGFDPNLYSQIFTPMDHWIWKDCTWTSETQSNIMLKMYDAGSERGWAIQRDLYGPSGVTRNAVWDNVSFGDNPGDNLTILTISDEEFNNSGNGYLGGSLNSPYGTDLEGATIPTVWPNFTNLSGDPVGWDITTRNMSTPAIGTALIVDVDF